MVVVQRVAMLVVVAAALEVVAVVVMVLVVSMELGTEAVEATVLVAMLLENATRYYTNLKKNLPVRCGARNKSNLVKNMLISTII
uniref:Uncharacterized protein n=1 Tax=Populus trichocarpa TaxID=3694 RepID=A0A3N7EBW2_POPTR